MTPIRIVLLTLSLLAILPMMSGCTASDDEVVDPALAIRGKRVANRCVACHAVDSRENKIGPHLVAIVGREVADARGYEYSAAMKAQRGEWSRDRLLAFLRDPQAAVPGNKMAISPMNEVELEGLMVYLESLQ